MKFFRLLLWVAICFGSTLLANSQVPVVSTFALRASNDRSNLPVNADFTVHRDVQEAQIHFVATDRAGKPVLGLHPEDVQVFDDQFPVPELKSFKLSQYKPLEVGVLVDLSDSISSQQRSEVLIGADLLADIFDASRDQAFVVGFSSKVLVLQPETTDISLIRKALIDNPGRQGLTSLFDAIVQTCRSQFSAADSAGRQRILLLFSDGSDTLSIHGPDQAVSEARRAGITIYAITANNDDSDGLRNLSRLTEPTGGKVYLIPKKQELQALNVAMSQSLRGEYTITFHPATGIAGFHPVKIALPMRQDVTLRADDGYYMGTN